MTLTRQQITDIAKSIGVIYKITSPSGRIYIGQAKDLNKRLKGYRMLNCSSQPMIYKSLIKYGYINHTIEVIEEVDIERLDEREMFYIEFFKCNRSKYPKSNGLNCNDGGLGNKGYRVSDETKIKLRLANIGTKQSEETKNKRSLSSKGKKRTKEFKDSCSIRKMGMGNPYFGKPTPMSKRVKQFSLDGMFIKEFRSIKEAIQQTGVNKVGECANGLRISAGGYKWGFSKSA